ncbi:MAG: 2'-5' RNA ligase family protein [Phyllobacterium sp.]
MKRKIAASRSHSEDGASQPCLPGFEIDRLDNLLFAICPDENEASCVEKLTLQMQNELMLRGQSLGEGCFHLSIFGLGVYHTVPRSVVDRACDAARLVKTQPFEIGFDRVMSFRHAGGKQPLVLLCGKGADELRDFRHELGMAMKRSGLFRYARGSFTPHVTMLYDWKTVPERKIEPIVWKVHGLVLIHSLYGQHHHNRLAHWPFGE